MKNKNYIWIVEAKASPSKFYTPLFSTFRDTHYGPAYQNRTFARIAAKYMQENNPYNHGALPLLVKYRVVKYQKA